ncbi:MAG: ankyrin repeat domain-containing protein [Proteobacteria bacterium]|nr:ankyrin repeat domain-containing protein [Pseudomonadota bacterium]
MPFNNILNFLTSVGPGDLLDAAYDGDAPIVKDLLARGADSEEKNGYGETPLIVAVREGHVDIVRLLLEHGADPSARNNDGKGVLDYAGYHGRAEIGHMLRSALAQSPKIATGKI